MKYQMQSKYENSVKGMLVVGDVHGDLLQFIYPLLHFISDIGNIKKLIYLGDYIDRGFDTVFIYEIIRALIGNEEIKRRIIFLRGNHECTRESTYDTFHTLITANEAFNGKSLICSYLFEEFRDLPFDVIHYDEPTNIVFSHAPISRSINEVLKMNNYKTDIDKCYEYTTTNESEHKNMEYGNVHGHTHSVSNDVQLQNFLNGSTKMICIDGDASYGFDIKLPKITLTSNVDVIRLDETCNTNLIYLHLNPSTSKCELLRKCIDNNTSHPNNIFFRKFRFNDIIDKIKNTITYALKHNVEEAPFLNTLLKVVKTINYEKSKVLFYERAGKYMNVNADGFKYEWMKYALDIAAKSETNTKLNAFCYYHDFIYEFFNERFGVEPQYIIRLLMYNVIRTYRLYVISNGVYSKKRKDEVGKASITGGNERNKNMHVILATVIILIVIIAIIVMFVIQNNRNGFNKNSFQIAISS